MTYAFVVMRVSGGGVTLKDIKAMSFPELVEFWEVARDTEG